MKPTMTEFSNLIKGMSAQRLQELRPMVEGRMKNEIAASQEATMLQAMDRSIASKCGDTFYIDVDATHRLELTPTGTFYPQRYTHDHWVYYHPGNNLAKCVQYRTETGAMRFLETKMNEELGTPHMGQRCVVSAFGYGVVVEVDMRKGQVRIRFDEPTPEYLDETQAKWFPLVWYSGISFDQDF